MRLADRIENRVRRRGSRIRRELELLPLQSHCEYVVLPPEQFSGSYRNRPGHNSLLGCTIQAPCTLDAKHDAPHEMERGPILVLVAWCVACCLRCEQSCCHNGFSRLNLLRFVRRVQCAWGLSKQVQISAFVRVALSRIATWLIPRSQSRVVQSPWVSKVFLPRATHTSVSLLLRTRCGFAEL